MSRGESALTDWSGRGQEVSLGVEGAECVEVSRAESELMGPERRVC